MRRDITSSKIVNVETKSEQLQGMKPNIAEAIEAHSDVSVCVALPLYESGIHAAAVPNMSGGISPALELVIGQCSRQVVCKLRFTGEVLSTECIYIRHNITTTDR